jgi:hypothetical protein
VRGQSAVIPQRVPADLYEKARLTVCERGGRERALGTRAPMAIRQDQNLRGFARRRDGRYSGRKAFPVMPSSGELPQGVGNCPHDNRFFY